MRPDERDVIESSSGQMAGLSTAGARPVKVSPTADQATRPLTVRLLGPVTAWLGQDELALGPARQRLAFSLLALSAGRAVARSAILDALWGEHSPVTAEGSIYTYVSALRRALDPERRARSSRGLLRSAGSGYLLEVSPAGVDALLLETHRNDGENSLRRGDCAAAIAAFDRALGLWHGEPLTGLTGNFVDAQRARLAELRLTVSERRAEAILSTPGNHSALVGELTALVAEYPLREGLVGLLMRSMYLTGRRADALRAYAAARRRLTDELGISPSPALQQLHNQVLSDAAELWDPLTAGPDRLVAGAPSPSVVRQPGAPVPWRRRPDGEGRAPLVGRDSEVQTLRRRLAELMAGRGGFVVVEGEAGIGKSELLAILLDLAESAGCELGWAVGDAMAAPFPLQVMRNCLGVDARTPDTRRAGLADALYATPGHRGLLEAVDPVISTIDRLVSLVEELSAATPLVLVVDDLHWADPSSLLLFGRLAELVDQLPVLLVCARRPGPRVDGLDHAIRAGLARGGVRLKLGPLTKFEVGRLVTALVGAPPGPALSALAGHAAGNPLYLRELMDALLRENALCREPEQAELVASYRYRTPLALAAAIDSRASLLRAGLVDMLRVAAILGAEFSVVDLAAVLGQSAGSLTADVMEAIDYGVLTEVGSRLTFRHPLLRQALYDETPAAVREAIHLEAALVFISDGAPPERVAEQLVCVEGQFPSWTIEWLVGPGLVLGKRVPLVAVELLERISQADSDEPRMVSLIGELAKVLFRIGRDADAESYADHALPRLSDPDEIAELEWIVAHVNYRRSDVDSALRILEQAIGRPQVSDLWRARITALHALVQRAGLGNAKLAEDLALQAIELGHRAEDRFAVAYALEVLWQIYAIRRDYVRSVEFLDRALELVGEDNGLADLRAILLDNRIFTWQCLDRLAEAEVDLRTSRMLAGKNTPTAALSVSSAVHDFWAGRWDDTRAELESIAADSPDFLGYGLHAGGPVLLMHGVAALIATHRDDAVAAERYLHAARSIPVVTASDQENCDFLLAAQAMVAAQRGFLPEAVQTLSRLLRMPDPQMMMRHQWLPDLVRMALIIEDRDTAREAVELCEREAALETTPARGTMAARRCRAMLDSDAATLASVAAHYRSVGRVFELAQTAEDAALLFAAEGDGSRAHLLMDEALSLYRQLSATWDVRRAQERMSVFHICSDQPAAGPRAHLGWDALSATELKVVELVLAGCNNVEIAGTLFLSRRTVQAHIRHVLDKLGLGSRHEIARAAARRLDVRVPPPTVSRRGAAGGPGSVALFVS
ncbi:MAG: transcriptional regulator, putative ATPase, winged helix family [Frankiales bacterium]|nr:transcriptional regulator, putative ATPase, winged helix family [Frankiales bacterium]